MKEKKFYLEEEAIIIGNSGEIPEIAYHGSLFYLMEDADGPGLNLTEADLLPLKKMVVARYQEIIRRDLLPENRTKSSYRGVARSYANWLRLKNFCQQEGFDFGAMKKEAASLLQHFLHNEAAETVHNNTPPCINLTADQLDKFIHELGLTYKHLPARLEHLCPHPE